MNIEKLPTSNADAQKKLDRGRKYNLKEGLDARYDVFGDSGKMEKLDSQNYTSLGRITRLFEALRAAQHQKKVAEEEHDMIVKM